MAMWGGGGTSLADVEGLSTVRKTFNICMGGLVTDSRVRSSPQSSIHESPLQRFHPRHMSVTPASGSDV